MNARPSAITIASLQGARDLCDDTGLLRSTDGGPDALADKTVLTDEEAADLEARSAARRVDGAPRRGDPGTYNQFWFDFGDNVLSTKQTALVVDPPSGKLPPLTPKARRAAESGKR